MTVYGSSVSYCRLCLILSHPPLVVSVKSILHAYADDSTLLYFTSFIRRPTTQEIIQSRLDVARRLTSDLAIISDWVRRNFVSFSAS